MKVISIYTHKFHGRENRAVQLIALVLIATILGACGGGGGGGDQGARAIPVGNSPPQPQPPPTPPPPPPAATASIPLGLPALYISTSEDASVFNDIIGDFIKGSTQSFVQFVPASGEAVLLATNRSFEFASSTAWIKTFDDQVYFLTTSETRASASRPDSDNLLDSLLESGGSIPTPRQQESASEKCFAVVGNDLFYKVTWRDTPFPGTGYEDAETVRVDDFFAPNAGRNITILDPGIGGDSVSPGGYVTDACYSIVDVAEGIMYDTQTDFPNGQVNFYERNTETGDAIFITGIIGLDAVLLTNRISNFAFDERMVYFALLDPNTQEVQILRQQLFGDFAIQMVLPPTTLAGPTASFIDRLDVDDGYVTFVLEQDSGNSVGLFDPTTQVLDVMDLGVRVNQLALIFRAQ